MPSPPKDTHPQDPRHDQSSNINLTEELDNLELPQLQGSESSTATFQQRRAERELAQGRYYSEGCIADL